MGGGGNLATATLGGTAEGGAATTAAGLAVAVVAVAVAVVVAVAVMAVVFLLGEKTVLARGALSECECVPNKCSVHSLTESLCIITPLK